jgi:catalase (peroxidase I)
LALLEQPFREYVELYAKDQAAFFEDFSKAWVKLQENGCEGLRDTL